MTTVKATTSRRICLALLLLCILASTASSIRHPRGKRIAMNRKLQVAVARKGKGGSREGAADEPTTGGSDDEVEEVVEEVEEVLEGTEEDYWGLGDDIFSNDGTISEAADSPISGEDAISGDRDDDTDDDDETAKEDKKARDDDDDDDYAIDDDKVDDDKTNDDKTDDDEIGDDETDDETDGQVGDDETVVADDLLNAEESLQAATSGPETESPTAIATEATAVATNAPSVSATVAPTESPVMDTGNPTFESTSAATFITTEVHISPTEVPIAATTGAPVFTESTPAPTSEGDGMDGTAGTDDGGMFDGEDYYHNHLVPFAVSVEGDDVKNDLGISSCLLTEMQKNLTSLYNLEMENFTIVEFKDEDGDGFKRFELYFTGFGEFVGLPVYEDVYSQEVQMNAMGDGFNFYQQCLDARWGDTDQSYTASKLDHDQTLVDHHDDDGTGGGNGTGTGSSTGSSSNPDGIQGGAEQKTDTNSAEDDNSKLETNLIIGLVVAGVVVALVGIIFASRVLAGNRQVEEENGKLLEGKGDGLGEGQGESQGESQDN